MFLLLKKRKVLFYLFVVLAFCILVFGVYLLIEIFYTKLKGLMFVSTVFNNQNVQQKDRDLYLGKIWENRYFLVNLKTGETKDFIPDDYTLLAQHNYLHLPTFLILQKDGELFFYDVLNKIPKKIFISKENLRIKQDESVTIYPSITEKDKFIINIDKLNLSQQKSENASFEPRIMSSQTYLFDASKNYLVGMKNFKSNGCVLYDSKNQRFFTWLCGEGVGSSLPLYVSDMEGRIHNQAVSLDDFGFKQDDIAKVAVYYSNGLFFVFDTYKFSKIIILDPQSASLVKETYTFGDPIKLQIGQLYPYSISIDKGRNTIIIGGDNFILLLRFDNNKNIVQSKYILEKEVYANFIFVNEGKLYYQSQGDIRVVDLDTWQAERTITQSDSISERFLEITLFAF